MFEKFTDRARRVVVLADDAAKARGALQITSAHLLYAITLEGECAAAKVLAEHGALATGIAERYLSMTVDSGPTTPGVALPFSKNARGAMDRAQLEAAMQGHNYVGAEHLLLGLMLTPGSTAVRILTELTNSSGFSPEKARAIFGFSPQGGPAQPSPEPVNVSAPVPEQRAFKDNARGRVLALAESFVNRDRNNTYGEPIQDFARTAGFWNIWDWGVIERRLYEAGVDPSQLDPVVRSVLQEITEPHDVAAKVSLLKKSRQIWNLGHVDSPADDIGYEACYVDCLVAEGYLDINSMPSVWLSPVDPEPIPPEQGPPTLPDGFDRQNQYHVYTLLTQMAPGEGYVEPSNDELMKMSVLSYADMTKRKKKYAMLLDGLWGEGIVVSYTHGTIGEALAALGEG